MIIYSKKNSPNLQDAEVMLPWDSQSLSLFHAFIMWRMTYNIMAHRYHCAFPLALLGLAQI